MKKLFLAMAVATLTFASCSKEELVNETPKQKGKITTSIEQGASNSRLTIDSNNTISWSQNDVIRIFMVNDEHYDYKYDANGDFVPVDATREIPDNTANTDVLGVYAIPVDDDPVYDSSPLLTGDKLTAGLPQNVVIQSSTDGTVMLPMWGTWDEWNISFKHLAGVLRVNLEGVPEGYDLLSVIADKPISGTVEVEDVTANNAVLKMATDGVENHMNIRFTRNEDKTLYLALPVETYTSIKVQISKYDEDLDDGQYKEPISLATYTNKTVERAYIYTASMNTVKVWDGETLVQVADKDASASKVLYEVAHAEELAWVLRAWNGDVTSASRPTTIKLLNDIDFGGHEIYFDMQETSVSFHCVTLDGNNHTIKNYKVAGVTTGGEGYKAGLFPQTSGVTIKDLTIDNAIIGSDQTSADLYSGALIGIATDQKPTPYTTVIENVVVQNSSISGVNKVGGLIGQANGIHIVSGAEVKSTTITGYGTDAGSLGGLYGYLKVEGESSFTNSKMTGGAIVCEEGEDIASRGSSGFIGTLGMSMASSSLALTGCEVSESTDLTKSNTESPLHELVGAVRSGTAATLTIDDEAFYYFVKTWNGSSVVQVSDTDASASEVLYKVAHAEELAWVLRNWNGGSTSASRPTTIKLLNDIDFGGHEIYFDMQETSVSFHCVTLDGNNHTIKNYKVAGVTTGGEGYKAGLFPQTSGVTIKDLTIDNAIIGSDQTSADLYSGALIGIATDQKPTPYTTVIENVVVQNSSISGVNKVGGLIGQANGIHIVSGVEVKGTTITGYGTDAGSLGGLYGYLKVEGESSFTNSKMTGGAIVCEEGEDKASRGSSGFIGTLGMNMANSSLALTGCDVSESTDLTKSNTESPLHELVGAVRSGTVATLTIDGSTIDY